MDSKFFFEVNEKPTEISFVEHPKRLSGHLTMEYKLTAVKLYERIDNNAEAKYIYSKFVDPLDTHWFLNKYTLEAIFVPKEITKIASHIFIRENVLLNVNYGNKWISDGVFKNKGKLPSNWILSHYEGLTLRPMPNPIITKGLLIEDSGIQKPIIKYDYIHCGPLPSTIIDPAFSEKDVLYLSNLYTLQNIIPKYLNPKGYALFTSSSYSNIFEQDYHFIYLLKLCFDKVIVFRTKHLICIGFKNVPQNLISINGYIDTDINIKPLHTFVKSSIEGLTLKWRRYLADGDYSSYFKIIHKAYLENKQLLNLTIDTIDNDANLFSIRKVQKNPKNISKYLNAGINEEEGTFLYNLILKYSCKKVVEVGMANGISASYITSALKKQEAGLLISIDPFQSTQWRSSGIELLRDIQTKSYHKLIEKKSLEALPELLKRNSSSVDLVFVDGWHTFDYTLVDIFFAVFLLKVGGLLVIDDALHPGVENTLKYLDTNYTMLKRIKSPRSFGAYEKFQDDTRDWNFHKRF